MAKGKDMAIPEDKIVLDELTIKTFAPRAPRTTMDGVESEPPKLLVAFIGDLDRFIPHMNRIARVYRKSRAVRLTLEFVEQLEIPKLVEEEASKRPRLTDPLGTFPASAKNGQGADRDLADTKPIPHIAPTVDEFLDEVGARGKKGERRAKKRKEHAKA